MTIYRSKWSLEWDYSEKIGYMKFFQPLDGARERQILKIGTFEKKLHKIFLTDSNIKSVLQILEKGPFYQTQKESES